MRCENLQFNLPIYFDDALREDERALLDAHLAICPVCRQKLSDFQSLRNNLRVLARPQIPQNLVNSIKFAVAEELNTETPKKSKFFSESFLRWLEFRVMPYSVGVAATFIIGFLFLWTLTPAGYQDDSEIVRVERSKIMLTNPSNQSSDYYTFDADEEFLITQEDFAKHRLSVSAESPSINPTGALVALTKSLARGEMRDDEVVLVADVFGNGLAKIEQFVELPRDKKTLENINRAFNSKAENAPFVPAALDNRAETIRVVFKIQIVDVKPVKTNPRK